MAMDKEKALQLGLGEIPFLANVWAKKQRDKAKTKRGNKKPAVKPPTQKVLDEDEARLAANLEFAHRFSIGKQEAIAVILNRYRNLNQFLKAAPITSTERYFFVNYFALGWDLREVNYRLLQALDKCPRYNPVEFVYFLTELYPSFLEMAYKNPKIPFHTILRVVRAEYKTQTAASDWLYGKFKNRYKAWAREQAKKMRYNYEDTVFDDAHIDDLCF